MKYSGVIFQTGLNKYTDVLRFSGTLLVSHKSSLNSFVPIFRITGLFIIVKESVLGKRYKNI